MNLQTDKIQARTDGPIGWLVFNNPERHNAVSLDMAQAIPEVMHAYEHDPAVRVVVLVGAGERAFVAGSDISKFGAVRADPQANRRYREIVHRAFHSVYECSKPTIAMIRGYCIGGGLEYAANCDIRICSDDSTFAIPAGKLGLGFGSEGVVMLARVIGLARARELLFTARRINAQEAAAIGLVSRVVPAPALEAEVKALAQSIADNAPLTLAALKQSILELEKPQAEQNLARVQPMIDACFASQDYAEGRKAFAEKRKPNFQGR